MEKKSEVDENGRVWWEEKGLTDEQASEHLRGLTADEKARARFIFLQSNKLTVAPRELLELGSLKILLLGNNFISSLPSFIGKVTSLEGLYLNNNQLATLPASMTNLQQLWRYVNPRFSCFFSAHSLCFAVYTLRVMSSCRSIFSGTPPTTNPLRLFSRTLLPSLSSATKRCGPRQ